MRHGSASAQRVALWGNIRRPALGPISGVRRKAHEVSVEGSYAEHSELVRPPLLFIANNVRGPNALLLWSAGAFRVVIRARCAIALLGCSAGSGDQTRLSKTSITYTNVQSDLL